MCFTSIVYLTRLCQGLFVLEIPAPSELDDWALDALCAESVRVPGVSDASLRIMVTRGVGPPGVGFPVGATPTVITVSPMPTVSAAIYAYGLKLLLSAEEAFLTSSLRKLAPIVRVGEYVIGSGIPGPLAARLIAAHDTLVDRERVT